MEIMTRLDALNLGLKKFYSGKPCKYGHTALRFVSTNGCVACNSARAKQFATGRGPIFNHPLHPDDHAAARAYCQALDIARGRVPYSAPVVDVKVSAGPVQLPPFIVHANKVLEASRARDALMDQLNASRNLPPHIPKEMQ